jgi:hypothetical protein
MRLTAFLSLPLIVLALAPTQIAATVEPSSLTPIQNFTAELPREDSALRDGTTVKPTLLIAQESRTRRIQFRRNATSAVVEDAVVRGTRDTYLLRARRGQTMTVSITSLENNAVFDIQFPNGTIVQQEATSWRGVLSTTGDHKIIVGGTRGNATYRMQVSIR